MQAKAFQLLSKTGLRSFAQGTEAVRGFTNGTQNFVKQLASSKNATSGSGPEKQVFGAIQQRFYSNIDTCSGNTCGPLTSSCGPIPTDCGTCPPGQPKASIIKCGGDPFEATHPTKVPNAYAKSKIPLDFDRGFQDRLFDMLLNDGESTVPLPRLLETLKDSGLREDDPRLRGMYRKIRDLTTKDASDKDDQKCIYLDRETFSCCVQENLALIKRAVTGELIIPDFRNFSKTLDQIYWNCKANTNGVVASKIPQLARYTAETWGASMCTIDGQRYSQGDSKVPFSLQACCLPFAYSLAIRELGAETVHQYVGLEHDAEALEQIVLDHKNQPHNPMIDVGGIIVSSLIKTNLRSAERFDYMLTEFKKMASCEYLNFNNSVFLSEREVSARENALSYFMKDKQCFPEGVTIQETLDLYGQMSSIEANCDSASVMAATLANGGVCPLTGEKLLDGNTIRYTLSLMHSCGMNNYSGHFGFYVGLPCKSSMSGGMIIVIPNVGGLCTWSPPLDLFNNSVRGLQFNRDLVNEFNFHNYDSLVSKNKVDPRRRQSERDVHDKVLLLFSSQNGNLGALRCSALSGQDMTVTDYDGRTALHLAAAEGHYECVRFLVDKCCVPACPKDRFGSTPLDEAGKNNHVKTRQYLESKLPCN